MRPGWQVGDVALEDVQIGAADRRLGDLDDRVGGRRDVRLGTVFQGFLARALIDERLHHRRRLLTLALVAGFGVVMTFMAGHLSGELERSGPQLPATRSGRDRQRSADKAKM